MLDLNLDLTDDQSLIPIGKEDDRQNQSTSNLEVEGFLARHLGVDTQDISRMLKTLSLETIEELLAQTIPTDIRLQQPLDLPGAESEAVALQELKAIANSNQIYRSYIGMGYHNTITPPVIQRNILENPGWYTAYTPYQAEIAQGRLEALLNFQTMVIDLTGLEIANASLLDEGTAAAEAMSMSYGICKTKADAFFVDAGCHPQTIRVLKTRAQPLDIEIIVGNYEHFDFNTPVFGALLQYPATDGKINQYRAFVEQVHGAGGLVTMAADPLSLALLTPPGELGADIAVGSTQRFGVPLGYGGPHAAYFATREAYKRQVPGRIVGVSKDVRGNRALRLALQTREQHIRRDRATSNICTAQVLLAVIAGTYAVYHGPQGIRQIATRVHTWALLLAQGLQQMGYEIANDAFFDTVTVRSDRATTIIEAAQAQQINLRLLDPGALSISLDETTTLKDIKNIWSVFALASTDGKQSIPEAKQLIASLKENIPNDLQRKSDYLQEPTFNQYHSETQLLRYLHQLESKDLSLTHSMIPLGSCTMKLNATAEMIPIGWPEFNAIHPFAPVSQTQGYQTLFNQLETWLAEITGFAAVSLQPNAGSQGEYAGLQVIRRYHQQQGQSDRRICLIPESAHGTNPASAVMCGMKVVPVKCDRQGNIDLDHLQKQIDKHGEKIAAIMITYPSTHGVFEVEIRQICDRVHRVGAQVYLDGANMNAQVGLCRPGDYGADVCHLNLHKTFCIPHGGGGPGVGPIGVASHLQPFLPNTSFAQDQQQYHANGNGKQDDSIGAIAAAPWGSASILPISWMYIRMMGAPGLTAASAVAILNANYIAKRLEPYYSVLFKGESGLVAHECIIDLRPLKKRAGVEVEDVAKRLMDYGFHAPTVSWPVTGTIMIEPTESESQAELDRFCEAMIGIYEEFEAIEQGKIDPEDNPLKNAPHTVESLCEEWQHPYSRTQAVYPTAWTKERKFWVSVARIDNAFGDRNLICSCEGMEAYQEN